MEIEVNLIRGTGFGEVPFCKKVLNVDYIPIKGEPFAIIDRDIKYTGKVRDTIMHHSYKGLLDMSKYVVKVQVLREEEV